MKKLLATLILFTIALSVQAIQLAWDANPPTDNVTAYNIYEHIGTNYAQIGSVNAPTTTFTLGAVTAGPHSYVVTAVNVAGESTRSNEVVLPALPGAPTNLRVQ